MLQITLQSAASTLHILDRQARRDTGKLANAATSIINILTSPAAVKRYRIAAHITKELAVIACMVAIAFGASTRDLWESLVQWADQYVEQCQQPIDEAIEPVTETPTERVKVFVQTWLLSDRFTPVTRFVSTAKMTAFYYLRLPKESDAISTN